MHSTKSPVAAPPLPVRNHPPPPGHGPPPPAWRTTRHWSQNSTAAPPSCSTPQVVAGTSQRLSWGRPTCHHQEQPDDARRYQPLRSCALRPPLSLRALIAATPSRSRARRSRLDRLLQRPNDLLGAPLHHSMMRHAAADGATTSPSTHLVSTLFPLGANISPRPRSPMTPPRPPC